MLVTITPTIVPQTMISGCGQPPALFDQRDTAHNIVASYINALNRLEYSRAYGYLSPLTGISPADSIPDFATWKAQYSSLTCLVITFTGDPFPVTSATEGYDGIGTGLLMPVQLAEIGNDGSIAYFAGTFAVRYDMTSTIAQTGAIDPRFSLFYSVS